MASIIRDGLAFPVKAFALDEPSWTRLEPQSVSGDPSPGLEARVHDPLWLLGRQWQLGEFEGDDAGSPVSVRIATTSGPVTHWQPGPWTLPAPAPWREFQAGGLLESVVEREPRDAAPPTLRLRAEAGAAFLAALEDAGLDGFAPAALSNCPLDAGPAPASDPGWPRLAPIVAGRLPDAEKLCAAIDAAGGAPPWLTPASQPDRDTMDAIVQSWKSWYRAEISPLAEDTPDSWVGERLEHRFSVAARTAAGEAVLRAPAFHGGRIDWYTFDADLQTPFDAPGNAVATNAAKTLVATPLRFPGMPADRLWEFEDAEVNLGSLEVQPYDLARLLLVEFALTYGSDWIVVPLDVPCGALTRIDALTYTTTFGEHFVVERTDRSGPGNWRMYVIDGPGGALDGLLVPPSTVATLEGPAVEEVLFLRDELANLVWGVESRVQGASGATRRRADEAPAEGPPPEGTPVATAQLDYLLATGVPAHWIPYLPVSAGYRSIELRQGAMPRFGPAGEQQVRPVGRLLLDPANARIIDAEVPRDGVRVRRVPVVARRTDGSYAVWTARRTGAGRGEGSSGLAFDNAIPRTPDALDTIGMPAPPDEAPLDPEPQWQPVAEPRPPLGLDQLPELEQTADPHQVDGHVKLAQAMLNAAGAAVPALAIDGNFGPLTAAAVRGFQTTHFLPDTGTIDAATWSLLSLAGPQPQLEPGLGDPPMAGPPIVAVQWLLNVAGLAPAIPATGEFDAATSSAVRQFQEDRGLAPSSVVDLPTWLAFAGVPAAVEPTGALRFTFSYDVGQALAGGTPVELVSREEVTLEPPPSDSLAARPDAAGFWVELQDAFGQALYRRDLYDPFSSRVELGPGEGAGEGMTVQDPSPAGSFEVTVPALPQARTLALFSSPLDPARREESAALLASFPV